MNALNNKSQTESSVTSVRGRALDLGSRKFWRNGVLLLVATVAILGFVDYRLLRFYERGGRALRVERHVPWSVGNQDGAD